MRVFVLLLVLGCHRMNSAPVDHGASVCDAGWIVSGDECFYLETDPVTSWSDAQSQCLSMSGDLATPADSADSIAMLMTDASETSQTKFWLGEQASGNNGNDLPADSDSGNTQCNFIEQKGSQEISFGTMDCDTPNIGFMCVKYPQPAVKALPRGVTVTATPSRGLMPAVGFQMIPTSPSSDFSLTTDDSENDGSAESQTDQTTDASGPLMAQLVQGIVEAVCRENWFLDASGTKCYFIAPVFDSGSYFETTEFCEGLGASLVQPTTQDELTTVDEIVNNITTWTQGPWIGLIRPFGDSRVVQATTGMSLDDVDLASALVSLINSSDPLSNCAGYSQGPGASLDFYSCNMQGNPFCEMPALYEFLPVNMTMFTDTDGSTTDSSKSGEDMSTSETTSAPVEVTDGDDK